jgi:general secretion pathway protein G
MAVKRNSSHRAFTLVEILIVVVILGILAAIVVPQFTSATNESRENALKMSLHRIRQQLEIYEQQHDGDYPSLENFEEQMTLASDSLGNTAAVGTDGFPHGPYIREIPKNPFTSTNTVGDGAVGDSDWYYDEITGEFAANDEAEHRLF